MKTPCISGASPETVENERTENKASLKDSQTKEDRQLPPSSSKCRMHVEVVVKSMCPTSMSALKEQWQAFLGENDMHTLLLKEGTLNLSLVPEELRLCCKRASIMFDENSDAKSPIEVAEEDVHVHVYKLSEEEPALEELEPNGGDDEWTAACDNTSVPHVSLDGVWESLILPPGIKRHLLEYALSALLFSDKGVSPNIVSWNRLLLLHGPPGTGKTMLCRSLAHKLAIRLGHRFPSGATLLEIHSHSLFSKWFSTSGKLISRLFELVREMVQEDPKALVVVLVDEVESLAGSRSSLGGAGEPSDAMRAVNALLTSLDRLRSFPNVLVLATSNLTSSVDVAFLDRADLKLYVGLPIVEARYEIFRSSLLELVRAGIIESNDDEKSLLCPLHDSLSETMSEGECGSTELSRLLVKCAEAAEGLSGRSLRRLPLQSHALYIQSTVRVSMRKFIEALRQGVIAEQGTRRHLDDSV